ncbi:response regulator transcription factor [Mucilaginibacter corticis]|uniref:Response regulator transcription factor n=1 Tax=Mucilaginibacter corticis TaxID=2597670 RepID=A0A556M8X3_9SPHI|nr:response regulator [Mucilaginibacter corticis]TSJ36378.1 response regulator transcription factor [Mucilaginibacter corticis]
MRKRIVILEDDPDLLECLTLMLESAGWTVIPMNQTASPEVLLAQNPDCILLDEKLPHISGHTICIILKTLYKEIQIPVILMSGIPDLHEKAMLCEADAFVPKPFINNQEFLNIVSGVVN